MCEISGWVLDHAQDNDPASEYAKNCRVLVDMLIEYLDGIDPDPDVEDGADDEPSLGSHEITLAGGYLPSQTNGTGVEVEEQCEDEGVTV